MGLVGLGGCVAHQIKLGAEEEMRAAISFYFVSASPRDVWSQKTLRFAVADGWARVYILCDAPFCPREMSKYTPTLGSRTRRCQLNYSTVGQVGAAKEWEHQKLNLKKKPPNANLDFSTMGETCQSLPLQDEKFASSPNRGAGERFCSTRVTSDILRIPQEM